MASFFYFHSKHKNYRSVYTVDLSTLQNDKKILYVIAPLPIETEYQKIISPIAYTVQPSFVQHDPHYDNPYAIWKLNASSKKEKTISYSFSVTVQTRNKKIDRSYTISDYKQSQQSYAQYPHPDLDTYLSSFKNETNLRSLISVLNAYVIDHLSYGNPIQGLYTLPQVMDAFQKSGLVDCGGFDVFLGALLGYFHIPSRIVSGFWAGNNPDMHAWLDIMLPSGDWIPADPSVEYLFRHGRTKKYARLGYVGNDRIAFSRGSNISLEIEGKKIFTDILQNAFSVRADGSKAGDMHTSFKTKSI